MNSSNTFTDFKTLNAITALRNSVDACMRDCYKIAEEWAFDVNPSYNPYKSSYTEEFIAECDAHYKPLWRDARDDFHKAILELRAALEKLTPEPNFVYVPG